MAVSLAACGGSSETDDKDEGEDDDDDVVVPPVNKAVALIIGQDLVEAGADTGEGDDTITGTMLQDNAGATNQSFDDADEIDGGDGDDTLTVTIDTDVAAIVSNVEVFVVRGIANNVTVDMGNFDDSLESIFVRDSEVDVTIDAVQSAASIELVSVTGAVSITYDDDVLGSDEATVEFTVDGFVGNLGLGGGDISFDYGGDDVVTTIVINAVGDDSSFDFEDDDDAETLIINGTAAIEVTSDAEFDNVTLFDFSGNSGGVTLESSSSEVFELIGSSGDDSIAVTVAGTDGRTIDLGAGDDTIEFVDAGDLNADDSIDGGVGDNTIVIAADDLETLAGMMADETVQNFATVAIAVAATAAVAFDGEDTGIETLSLTVDLSEDISIDNFSGGTLSISADQDDAIDVLTVGTADSITVVFEVEAASSIDDMDLTDVETVTFDVGTDDDVVFDALELSGVTTLIVTGEGDIDMSAATSDALETVDLSAATGVVELDLSGSAGVEVIVGDLGDGSTITLAAAGSRETVVFGDTISNAIEIDGFDVGNTITDDVIDLSSLGIDFDDLEFDDDGTDTTITSDAFDGSIVLLGVADWTTLVEDQFVM